MKSTIRLQGQLIRFLALFLATLTLAACGGGDGFPGYRNEVAAVAEVAALRVIAPSAVTVTLGSPFDCLKTPEKRLLPSPNS